MLLITVSMLALSMVVGGHRYMGFQKADGYNRIMQESAKDQMETRNAVRANHCHLVSTSIHQLHILVAMRMFCNNMIYLPSLFLCDIGFKPQCVPYPPQKESS